MHRRLGLVGLTALEERAYLHQHVRDSYTGAGEIVELGCWLGSLTSALALGLEECASPGARFRVVHAYDRFVWTEWMGTLPAELNPDGLRPGDAFRAAFEERIAPWRSRVAIHEGDLLEVGWTGGPIELLVVDAMKSPELTCAIVRDFYPHLIPNRSYLFHQDFAHEEHPWIRAAHERLADFEPVLHVAGTDAVLFRTGDRPIL